MNLRQTMMYGVYYDADARNSTNTVAKCVITTERDLARVGGDVCAAFDIDYLERAIKMLKKSHAGIAAVVISQSVGRDTKEKPMTCLPLILTDAHDAMNSVMIAPRYTSDKMYSTVASGFEDKNVEDLCKTIRKISPTRLEIELAIAEVGLKEVSEG